MKAAQLLKMCRKAINPPYTSKDLTLILATLIILIAIPLTVVAVRNVRELRSRAAAATLYLSPASQTVTQATTFNVQVRENSSTDPVNAVQANLTYDTTKLDFVSISNTGSAFGVEAENTGGAGAVRIARGVTGGQPPVTGDQLVATITFRAKTSLGATSVTFAAGSAVIRSTDNVNILATTTGGTYTIGDPPPVVSITNPPAGSTIKGTVTVTATATDDLGVTKVEFLVDGTVGSTDTTAPYEYSLNTTSPVLADGVHTVSAKAYDATSSTTATINVIVDNNAPTASITAPTAGSFVRGTAVPVTATTSDAVGVTKVEFLVDGVLKSTDTTSPYSYSWDTTTYTNAAHTLQAKAYDNANNIGNSAIITVNVDNAAPTVSITAPAAGAYLRGPSVSVTATASDTGGSGMSKVEFSLDTTILSTDTTSPYGFTLNTTTASDGSHTISAKAYDVAGNTTTATIPVTVDNTAPSVPTGLAAAVINYSKINLSWSASTDAGSGIANYEVYRGGSKIATPTTTSYLDSGLTAQTAYSYYIKAVDRAGNVSAASTTVNATTVKIGDIDKDGRVAIVDLSMLLTRWGTADAAADLNNDGIVDINDLAIFLSNWEG